MKRNKPNKYENKNKKPQTIINNDLKTNEEKLERLKSNDLIDKVYGFECGDGSSRCGWLMNMKASDVVDDGGRPVSGVDLFFLEDDGGRFKASVALQPYLYLASLPSCESEVCTFLTKKYGPTIAALQIMEKEDLDLDNHLSGLKRKYIKVSAATVDDLAKIRKDLLSRVSSNKKREETKSMYGNLMAEHLGGGDTTDKNNRGFETLDKIVDIREHDVPYLVRSSIDLGMFVGSWYEVQGSHCNTKLVPRPDLVDRPDAVVLAYDIETTKLPLKFPDASFDQIMMISYMVDGLGYLICNRELISADVDDFEFTPRAEFPGPFIVFNEADERQTILRFFEHIKEVKPNVIVTYNGDSFDWPFVEARAVVHDLDLNEQLGFERDSQGDYKSRCVLHMDCFRWVQRDSYLPVGSQGLKAVCKAKLHYDPVEVDPEDMCAFARDQPRTLANYSVSDAVATYYLYMKYVHPFIFALCTIIPLEPDEVLRKGSGTLCESLLMVQAHMANIIFPNKQDQKYNELTSDGHLLESETYVGGHVEAIESGVFRADIPTKFRLIPDMCQTLRTNLVHTFTHALTVEEKVDMSSISNFEEVIAKVDENLYSLQQVPNRLECPVIYHLDVAAMYPNIILSNRLQPSAVMKETDKTCASCDHNGPAAKCKRPMQWVWRGEIMPASKSEYYLIQSQLEKEKFPPKQPGEPQRSFYNLSRDEKAVIERDRLSKFCRKAYKKTHITREEERTSIVCQKENSFYVDTVRSFRDRRYEFKDLTKIWKKTLDKLSTSQGDPTEIKRASGMLVLYDSLQLAHKCILNSFYGYVMRRGARWYSMEMAGIVCNTGAAIIKSAREIIDQIGRPLELDTDGIWCILPSSFPENVTFNTTDPKRPSVTVSYPGAMLNVMVQSLFTNDQYHDLVDPLTRRYTIKSENSIFFEVDGPYKAMILPASKEQGKKLKKRYAVFNFDNSLAELKGFEVKRNGELNLIKIFQSSVFEAFLKGTNLKEVYDSVAVVADRWLDLLHSKGVNTPDEELLDLISEKRCMSKKLTEYGKQKSTSLSTARRLAEFLGDEMVKDSGLSIRFIISKKPEGLQVTERAIPTAIFQAESNVRRHYLRKWLKIPNLEEIDLRDILDWEYYTERFNSNVQKIITIPAAFQHISNPVPRVLHPEWLHKKLMEKEDTFKQRKINDMFEAVPRPQLQDIENLIVSRKRKQSPPKIYSHWKEQILLQKPHRKETKLWLEYHKKKWEIQRESRSHVTITSKNISTICMPSFLKRSKQSIFDETWQIVQIVETTAASPGVYRLWVLISHQLYSFKLSVPRTFYVNTRLQKHNEEDNNPLYKKVHHKILPRSHSVYHLYEYNMEESNFLKHKGDIFAEFVKNEIEGLYELNVPLLFRALVKLGCLCSVDKTHYKKSQGDTAFDLRDLKHKTVAQHSYLQNRHFKKVFFFRHKSGNNQIISVFFPALNKGHLFIIEPKKVENYSRYVKEISAEYKRRRNTDGGVEMTFEVFGESSEQSCFKSINKLLLSYKSDVKIPTIVLTMSNVVTNEKLSSHMSALNDFPIVVLPHVDLDASFNIVFNWQELALKCALNSFLNYDTVLEQQLERARYLHVPVGNLYMFDHHATVDKFKGMTSCDLFFARHLIKNDHILWCSNVAEPDLGGKETVDRRQMLLDCDVPIIQHNKPGSYPTVSVQLDMTYVIINTIIATERIQDIDGIHSTVFESISAQPKTIDTIYLEKDPRKRNYNLTSTASSYDDTVAAAPAFRILRKVFIDWINDVKEYKNTVADEHIINFYKWLRSPGSLLYDPALYKTLQKLMRKLFFKLIEQFSDLGVDVIYGSLNKIIICTRKTDLMEALLQVEYATKAVRNQEIFAVIDFQYYGSWEYLLWKDSSNFSGIKADLHSLSEDHQSQELSFLDLSDYNSQVFSSDLRDPARLDIEWHLQRYLSPDPLIQVRFIEFISEFMFSMWCILKNEYNVCRLERAQPSESQHQYSSLSMGHDASVYPTSIEKIDHFLQTEVVQRLYTFAKNVKDSLKYFKVVTIDEDDTLPPLLPLKYKQSQYPLVDLINTTCHIFSLDKSASNYTKDWKRNIFKVLGFDEYGEYAIWRSPYSNDVGAYREVACKGELLIIVSEFVCSNCSMVRDLDFCRERHCRKVNDRWCFMCPGCEKPYNKDDVESALLQQLNNLMELSLLQDLRCHKCQHGIIETVLASTRYCKKCGNSLECTRSSTLLEQQVTVYLDLAQYYDLEHLKSVSQWMLKGVKHA